jgi:hypothetical protein
VNCIWIDNIVIVLNFWHLLKLCIVLTCMQRSCSHTNI